MPATSRNDDATGSLQAELVREIEDYVLMSPLNRLRDIDGTPIWDRPLVGFANGDDPLFGEFKRVIGALHLTPREALANRDGATARAGSAPIGVLSWVLPAALETRLSNRRMTLESSRRWNHSRFQGEEFNDSLRRHVVEWLEARGYPAVAPVLSPLFAAGTGPYGRASTWSERHVAYVAGLGTFGLSDGLITARGIAHRCGSVVAAVAWEATSRPYAQHQEYCSFVTDGSCGECIRRCPAGAIGPQGHDKEKCREYLFVTLAESVKQPGYIGSYGACGLCQTKVPCESRIPRRG